MPKEIWSFCKSTLNQAQTGGHGGDEGGDDDGDDEYEVRVIGPVSYIWFS